ncbi:hypothetical protein Dimus_012699 [Dionaea muscipula]
MSVVAGGGVARRWPVLGALRRSCRAAKVELLCRRQLAAGPSGRGRMKTVMGRVCVLLGVSGLMLTAVVGAWTLAGASGSNRLLAGNLGVITGKARDVKIHEVGCVGDAVALMN